MARATPVIRSNAPAVGAFGGTALGPPRTLWGDAWRRFRKHKLAMAGAGVLLFFIIAVLLGPLLYRVNREALDFSATMVGPQLKHPLGTDDLGRDTLARVLYGGRISLAVGVVAMLIAIVSGTLVGSIAGFFGGVADNLLMRITDIFLTLPQDRKSTRLNSSHVAISYAVFCLKKKKKKITQPSLKKKIKKNLFNYINNKTK